MENRSFDHYFGWLQRLRGRRARASATRTPRASSWRRGHASTLGTGGVQWQGLRPSGSRATAGTRAARSCNGGFLAEGSGNDEFALSYYNRGELGFIHEAARNYTLYDRYFCSLLGPTWPNRYYKWSAQSGGLKTNTIQPRRQQLGDDLRPRARPRADRRATTTRTCPSAPLWGPRATPWLAPISPVLHGRRRRHAAEHRDRGPALHGRRRRRRALGRRAPARRRPARPGVPGRRGQRLRRRRRTTAAARSS